MSKMARFVVLVTAITSLFAVMSSTAGAVTWHVDGNTAFHATSTTPGTLASTGAGLVCPANGTATGNTDGMTFAGASPRIATGTVTWSGCTLGVPGYHVACNFSLTPQSLTSGVVAGLADVTCDVTLGTTVFCHIEGSTSGDYINPAGSANGSLTLTTGGSLTTTNGPGGTCPLGNGDRGHLSESTFALTPGAPVITRTA